MASFKTIQIILVIAAAAGTLSQESSASECYKQASSPYEDPMIKFDNAVVDASGQTCYKRIQDEHVDDLLTKTALDEAFANVSAEICPTWSNSKKCFFKHLTNKCNKQQIKEHKKDHVFNNVAVATELLCSQSEEFNVLNLFKQAAVDGGLADCFTSVDIDLHIDECVEASRTESVWAIPFQEIVPLKFECAVETIKNCAQDDKIKEQDLLALWVKFEKAVYFGYDAFWNEFETSSSDLLSLLK